MRIVRNVFRVAAYLGACGLLLAGWMVVLAWLGITSENVTPALAMILIPFMLWTGFYGERRPLGNNRGRTLRPAVVPVENRRSRA